MTKVSNVNYYIYRQTLIKGQYFENKLVVVKHQLVYKLRYILKLFGEAFGLYTDYPKSC